MLLDQGQTLYGRTLAELPDERGLAGMVDEAVGHLAALARAPVADPYTGPAILEPEATGVFFHETVGHRLEGERQKDENEGRTFKGQVGQAILPAFLSLRDDPTLRTSAGLSLNGYYPYDDEGVASRNTILVEKGVLRTYLTGRTPVEDAPKSNGHGRAQGTQRPVARMGNLIIEAADAVPRATLKRMLLDETRKAGKPYGLIIRDITGGSTNTSNYGYQAFKGSPRMVYRVDATTGAETLVRGVEMVGTPLTAVNKIIAASQETGVFNGFCGAESGYVPVSTVAPATLFREIELQRTQRQKERTPLLPAPWAPAGGGATP
jgi:predicted Zn-dependent protease